MGIYLLLHLRRWMTHPFRNIVFLLFPCICFIIVAPLVERTAQESAIPVAVVNEDDGPYGAIIISRLQSEKRIRLETMTRNNLEKAVQRGDVEAGFVLTAELTSMLHTGTVRDTVIWYRTSESNFDVFAKEKIGAEIMRIALNAKAANAVTNNASPSSESWVEIYEYADSFWEPSPLFTVSYTERQPGAPIENDADIGKGSKTVLGLFMLYAYIMGLASMMPLQKDKANKMPSRIALSQSHAVPFYSSYWSAMLVSSSLTFIIACVPLIVRSSVHESVEWVLWGLLLLCIGITFSFIVMASSNRINRTMFLLAGIGAASFILHMTYVMGAEVIPISIVKALPHYWLWNKPAFIGGEI